MLLMNIAFLFLLTSSYAYASLKALEAKPGNVWKLEKYIRLVRNPMIPGNANSYSAIWDLKTNKIQDSGLAKNDSCEFIREGGDTLGKDSSLDIKSGTNFKISELKEAQDKISIVMQNATQIPPTESFKLECRAYSKGTATKNLAAEFKLKMYTSLSSLFSPNDLQN